MKVLVSCYHGQHLWLKEKRRTLQEQARLDREAAIVGILALGASRILLGLFTSASYSGPVILHLERLSENCLALCRHSSRRIRGTAAPCCAAPERQLEPRLSQIWAKSKHRSFAPL